MLHENCAKSITRVGSSKKKKRPKIKRTEREIMAKPYPFPEKINYHSTYNTL